MSLEARLANMRRYRDEAMQHPIKNKLYIEDLNISIAMFEKHIANGKPIIQQGWVDKEEESV